MRIDATRYSELIESEQAILKEKSAIRKEMNTIMKQYKEDSSKVLENLPEIARIAAEGHFFEAIFIPDAVEKDFSELSKRVGEHVFIAKYYTGEDSFMCRREGTFKGLNFNDLFGRPEAKFYFIDTELDYNRKYNYFKDGYGTDNFMATFDDGMIFPSKEFRIAANSLKKILRDTCKSTWALTEFGEFYQNKQCMYRPL